ncbi:unnamed protein product [Durusdinium trenchii]|uniref:RNase H type-1 domain-containing protein n=1 Tax=Durusdinium trenchii TaxID=1381693 RepID=A0ABP0KFD1_9DINO
MAEGRVVRPLFGAPAALRAGSSWAGTWTGVATISDFVSRPLTLSWQSHEYESGRLLATQHFVQGVCLTKAVVYGYPSSPTWPRSRALTTELLGVVTQDIVLGARGPRIIAGDFNASSTELSVFDTWRRLGWQSAQTWALDHWHQPVRMTYKGQTEPDQVWMSPEAQALCTAVRVLDHFMEHSTVQVQLDMLRSPGAVLRWTRPSVIPVAEVDDAWPSSQPASLPDSTDSDVLFQVWARSYESSFDGHLCSQPGSSLTPQQRGRFQHCSPSLHRVSNVVCRPSREGEVRMRNSLLGTSVVSWFRQLRRLQSYVHAIRAAKSSSSAVVYRLELWSAILAARGFDHSFSWWWQHFGWEADPCAPAFLPSQPPDVATAEAIFAAFRCRYEQFEAWHLNQRNSTLKQKHDRTLGALYQDLRKPAPEQLDGLCQEQVFSVIGFDNATHQIQLDEIPSLSGTSTWYLDGEPVSLLHEQDDLCTLVPWPLVSIDSTLLQRQFFTTAEEAWLQHVAFEACRRPSMTGLQGLDSALLADLHKGVSALHHSLQCSLHSGTFVDAAHHAKFDLAKTAWCSQCDCKDDQAHWWRCPRFSEFRRRSQLTPEILEAAPCHVSWHLLPSRNPTRRWFREYFHMRPNELAFVGTAIQPLEHVFTDGSSKKLDCGLSYASWAAISASSGQLISAAHLAGVDQTAARAEVSAVFAAVEWGAWQHIQLHLWVDSLFVVDNLHYLLRTGHVPLHWKHRDLWGRIHTALEQSEYPPLVTWIPSHIDPEACEDPWQDWVAAWNSKVDLCAGEMNERRSAEFWEQVTQAEEYHRTTLTLLTQVRSFYCHVAASSAESSTERAQVPESTASFDFEWVIDRNALSSQLPPVFEPMLERCAVTLPLTFLSSLLHLFLRWETQADGMYGCSFVELLVLLQHQGLPFPLCNPSTNQWELVPLARMPVRPTISSLIRLLRVAIGSIAEVFDISEMLSLSLNKLELGISAPVAGIFLMLPAALVRHARGGLLTITRGWPLRRAADYARPLPPGHSMG